MPQSQTTNRLRHRSRLPVSPVDLKSNAHSPRPDVPLPLPDPQPQPLNLHSWYPPPDSHLPEPSLEAAAAAQCTQARICCTGGGTRALSSSVSRSSLQIARRGKGSIYVPCTSLVSRRARAHTASG
ncbi:hypothetical protein K466DRAFT_588206 [Polyporus arcularius HHB13444]|uniref:Uncharacterized protein n=1 Tax=Polyporus arcularius HHB13444 TaxID=1314778 RepID=A0A5C3P6Q7_9APHY|nr:hypothetical protein K466DRAFT_588206 [Polyporus arcularius HHB13444]